MSAVSIVFGQLFWGITFADFPQYLGGGFGDDDFGAWFLLLVTVKVAFFSFKRGLDPDVMVYPVMSTVAINLHHAMLRRSFEPVLFLWQCWDSGGCSSGRSQRGFCLFTLFSKNHT